MLFGFYLLSLFAIRTQLRAKVLLFGYMNDMLEQETATNSRLSATKMSDLML